MVHEGARYWQPFARTLDHPAKDCLEQPFVHYVEDRPQKARKHFFGVSEAKPDFVGIVITDNLVTASVGNERLQELQWDRREIENYLCYPEVLEAYAQDLAEESPTDGPLFATIASQASARESGRGSAGHRLGVRDGLVQPEASEAKWRTTAEGHGRPIVRRVIQFRELFTVPSNHFPKGNLLMGEKTARTGESGSPPHPHHRHTASHRKSVYETGLSHQSLRWRFHSRRFFTAGLQLRQLPGPFWFCRNLRRHGHGLGWRGRWRHHDESA